MSRLVALAGLIGWGLLAVNWLGGHLIIVVPILAVLVTGFVWLVYDALTYEP